jgi:hypothetical protein
MKIIYIYIYIYIYTVEYYSALKKNEIVLFAGKWMELRTIMLSKINQTERETSITCSVSYAGVSTEKLVTGR